MLPALFVSLLASGCGRNAPDLRAIAPENALIYLETPDLGRLIGTITRDEALNEAASDLFDPGVVSGTRAAIAVTGFDASSEESDAESGVLSFRPGFVLIAEPNLWSWQMGPFVDQSLAAFVRKRYGEQMEVKRYESGGAEWTEWSAKDGRKAFAAVSSPLLFFGNSETEIREALSRSAAANPPATDSPRADDALAYGTVSKEGIRGIAQIAGISAAVESGEESQVVLSTVVAEILSNSFEGAEWRVRQTDNGVEDEVELKMEERIADALFQSVRPQPGADNEILRFVPPDAQTVTRYNLRDPRLAFRGVVLAAASGAEGRAAALVPLIGTTLLEPYGITDPENFLARCDGPLLTVQLDPDDDRGLAIVKTGSIDDISDFVSEDVPFSKEPGDLNGAKVWTGENGISAAYTDGYLILGDPRGVDSAVKSPAAADSGMKLPVGAEAAFESPAPVAVSLTRDRSAVEELAGILGNRKEGTPARREYWISSTEIERNRIRRRYLSRYGLTGYLVRQFFEAE